MRDTPGGESGWLESTADLVRTLATIARNRIELLLVEMQEERTRLIDVLLLSAAATACGLMALIMVSFTLVVVFWDEHRVAVLASLSVIYLVSAALGFRQLNIRLKTWQAFPDTLAEFKKDCAWLDESQGSNSGSANRP
jgi:uncharacterized membrane protein YqjE